MDNNKGVFLYTLFGAMFTYTLYGLIIYSVVMFFLILFGSQTLHSYWSIAKILLSMMGMEIILGYLISLIFKIKR